jgi:predicted nucleic acid-binding protein
MKYLLDSNTISDLYNRDSPQHAAISQHFVALNDDDSVYVLVLSLYEMEYGYANAPEDKKLLIRQHIQDMRADFELLPLSEEAAVIFGELKKSVKVTRMLSSRNLKQHGVDLMIAANAIHRQLIVVSDDSLFTDLANLDRRLRVENWLAK